MENNGSISAEGNSEDCEVVIVEEGNEELEEEEEMGLYLKDGEYNVEKLLDMKIEKGNKKFLVKWQGYPNSQNTWEPAEHLTSIPTMVEEFEKEYQRKKQLRTQEPQARKTAGNIHRPEPKSLKRSATANLSYEMITKKIRGNPQNEIGEEEYHAEESSPPGDQSPIAEDEESKSASSKPNQRKASKPPAQKKTAVQSKKDKAGSFKLKDKPLCIRGVKPGRNNEFFFLVEWEKRSDGTKPENSHVSNEQFKISAPRFLFEFYESKLVIFSRKKPLLENEEAKENNIESGDAFDNPLDSKKFSDKSNHQILEEMRRELDSQPMNDDDDDDDGSDFPSNSKLTQNNC